MSIHVSYTPVGDDRWRAHFLGHFLGEIHRGQASAYFRAPSGRGKLFSSCAEIERRLDALAARVSARVKESLDIAA